MKINQLFSRMIPEYILQMLLESFNLKSLHDQTEFTAKDLEKINTVDRFKIIIPLLQVYYLPCKFKIYLVDLHVQKCLTVLRQVIRLYNVRLISTERYLKKRKIIVYSLNNVDNLLKINISHTSVTIDIHLAYAHD